MSEDNAEEILGTYKRMVAECQQITAKINELTMDRDEHKLVVDRLQTLPTDRRAFRLVGGVLVERTVGEVLPAVTQNYEGIKELVVKLDETLRTKDDERREYKQKHGIMTQEEREAMLKQQAKQRA